MQRKVLRIAAQAPPWHDLTARFDRSKRYLPV
jgi:hypothetical protein